MDDAPPGIRRAVPITAGTSVTDTAEGRAFFQARLALLGKCLFLLSGAFQVVGALVYFAVFPSGVGAFSPQGPFGVPAQLQAVATSIGGALWLLTRKGTLPGRWLPRLDGAATLAMCGFFQASAAMVPDWITGFCIMALTTICTLVTRAIVIPSTARRTLIVSIECSLPLVVLGGWGAHQAGLGLGLAAGNAVSGGLWGVVAVTISTVASQTIFGLRRAVGEARVLGQYTLEEKIGEGGMGEVWRASHAMLRRPTAVKLLPAERTGEAALRRFEREVQLTARLTHPNTVAVYDYGRTPDGTFYYAMELLDGVDLEHLVATDGPQPPERVIHVLRQICGALAEAHDIGLVHRDIKPGNILVAPRPGEPDVAKIVDFGLVKDLEPATEDPSLTGSNVLTGTPLYLSPEAIQAPKQVGPRSDLYALGAVGWFLLVGRPPFVAKTVVEVCGHHLHTPPDRPSARLGRPLPQDLEDALLACLEKDPARRPADARALRATLEACTGAGGWTVARAADFWASYRARPRPAPTGRAPSPRTIAIDIGKRGAP